jgi:hypothetical protein
MDLGTICDKIKGYSKLLSLHGYKNEDCGGIKPWSTRYTQRTSKGILHVDTRNSEWTAYEGDKEVCSGPDPETLAQYLTGDYKNGTC